MKYTFLIVITTLLMLFHSLVMADPAQRERLKEGCTANLKQIGEAIAAYRTDHDGEMPDWLSDLYPKYLSDPKLLLCPADETGGTPAQYTAFKDPLMPSSYLYTFNPLKYPGKPTVFEIDQPDSDTFKEAVTIEMKHYGEMAPTVRCLHHSQVQILNLAYNGKVYLSKRSWGSSPEGINALLAFFKGAIKNNPSSVAIQSPPSPSSVIDATLLPAKPSATS